MGELSKTHSLRCKVETLLIFLSILLWAWLIVFIYISFIQESNKYAALPSQNPFAFLAPSISTSQTVPLPIGVILENELMSRPFQKGLSGAPIVYESPTEGGITRFMAVFLPTSNFPKVGPIRSARPYYADWIVEYGGALAHVGGSDEALNKLRQMDNDGLLVNIDQFYFGNAFWRESRGKTSLEHTMFSDGESLRELVSKENESAKPKISIRPPKTKHKSERANTISINYGMRTYGVKYEYDSKEKNYARSQAGAPHIDHGTEKQIAPKMVIIQQVNAWPLGDDKSRIGMDTVGSGSATIFVNGRVMTGTWQKDSVTARTLFFDDEKNSIDINHYPLWIEIVPYYNSFEFFDNIKLILT